MVDIAVGFKPLPHQIDSFKPVIVPETWKIVSLNVFVNSVTMLFDHGNGDILL